MEFRGLPKREVKPPRREQPVQPGQPEPPAEKPASGKKRRIQFNKKLVVILVVLIIIGLAGLAIFFYMKYNKAVSNPDAINQESSQQIVEKVSKLYMLPNEEPTVAQVSDIEKLKEQQFFKNAQNNDYLLVFSDAKLAILYREDSNLIINAGPLSTSENSPLTPGQ